MKKKIKESENSNDNIIAKQYFVDEAGDMTLFDKKGRIIIGNEGISKYFMVGVASFPNYYKIEKELIELREGIKVDPYFTGIPSISKTIEAYHACKDVSEIRHEVFKILSKNEGSVVIAIRNKNNLASFAKELFRVKNEKINENDIYDDLVKRVFKNLLHKADENYIYFSRRGKSHRNESLRSAIEKAQRNFYLTNNIISDKPVKIESLYPKELIGLQLIDYYLWAVQRLYEKHEDRFFNSIFNHYKLIMDLDDKRNKDYGEWYKVNNKLEIKKIML